MAAERAKAPLFAKWRGAAPKIQAFQGERWQIADPRAGKANHWLKGPNTIQ
jgi:hypothetical protein